jgi:hypothetical protein
MFLVVIQLIYLIDPPGRSLGFDALLWRRRRTPPGRINSANPRRLNGTHRSLQIAGERFQHA